MIAIKLYGPPGPLNPDALPAEWPSEVNPNCESLPPGYDLGFETVAEYEAYRMQHRAAYDAWANSRSGTDPVPFSVTARQLFPVLRRTHGITPEAIEAAISNPAVIADADDRADALIEFRRAYLIERSNPLIALLAGVFNLDDAQIDAAFIAAEKR